VDHPRDFNRIRDLNLAGMNIVSIQRPSAAEILAGIRRPLDAAALAAWGDALCGGSSSSSSSSSAGAGAGAGAGAPAAAGGLRYMDTLFDAPALVKAALVQEIGIHNMLYTPAVGAVGALNSILTARDRAHRPHGGGSSGVGDGAARPELGTWPAALSVRTPAQTLRVSVNMDGKTTRSGIAQTPFVRAPCLTIRPDDEAQRRLRGEDAAAADAAKAARSRATAAMQTKGVHEDALAAARAKLDGLRQARNAIKGLQGRVVTAERAVKERQEALNSDAAAEAQMKACVLARRQEQLGLLALYQRLEGIARGVADAQAAAQAATAAAAAASRAAAAAAAAYDTAQGNLKAHERSKDALSRDVLVRTCVETHSQTEGGRRNGSRRCHRPMGRRSHRHSEQSGRQLGRRSRVSGPLRCSQAEGTGEAETGRLAAQAACQSRACDPLHDQRVVTRKLLNSCRHSVLLTPCYIPLTSLLHPFCILFTPLLHPSYIPFTSLLHPFYVPALGCRPRSWLFLIASSTTRKMCAHRRCCSAPNGWRSLRRCRPPWRRCSRPSPIWR